MSDNDIEIESEVITKEESIVDWSPQGIQVNEELIIEENVGVEGDSSLKSDLSPYIQISCPSNTVNRKRSQIWTLFTPLKPGLVRCNICDKPQSIKGGSTGNMVRHIRNKHPNMQCEVVSANEENGVEPEEAACILENLQRLIEVKKKKAPAVEKLTYEDQVERKQQQMLDLDIKIKDYEAIIAKNELEVAKVRLELLKRGEDV